MTAKVMVKSVYGTFAAVFAAFLFSDTNTDKRLVQTTITELAVGALGGGERLLRDLQI